MLTDSRYIYGGYGFPPETTGYDDIYVLTIPSFQWIRGPYPPGSNSSGPFPKNMASCNVVNNAQMLVIGGTYSNDTTYMCDVEVVGGQHNMNFGEDNKATAIWAEYQPTLTTYIVPTFITSAVGGDKTGGARVTAPEAGFDAPDMSVQMTRKAVIQPRTPTRDVSLPTVTGPNNGTATQPADPKKGLSAGAIAGIAVGGAVALIALLAGCCFFIRQRQKHYQQPRHPLGGQTPSIPPNGWGGQGGPGNTLVSSPAMTQASFLNTPTPQSPHPDLQSPVMLSSTPVHPVELSTDNSSGVKAMQSRSFTASPASAKYDASPWSASTPQHVDVERTPSYREQDHHFGLASAGTPYWTPQQFGSQGHAVHAANASNPYFGGQGNEGWEDSGRPTSH